jgi:hypothetical protein
MDGGLVLLLEMLNRGEPTLQHVGVHGCKVLRLLLELTSASGDELGCQEGLSEIRDEESAEGEIKWKDRFHSIHHIKG